MSASTEHDVPQRWEQTSDVAELLKLSIQAVTSRRQREALDLACRKHALAVFCEMGGTDCYKAGIELVECVLRGTAKASELAKMAAEGGVGRAPAFGGLRLRLPGAAHSFAAHGLLVTDALTSVNRVITYAISYHVFTAIHRHPDWVRSECERPSHVAGAMSRTFYAFRDRHPDFEEPLQREHTLRQIARLRDALRPVLFPQAGGKELNKGRQDSGPAVRDKGLATLPCACPGGAAKEDENESTPWKDGFRATLTNVLTPQWVGVFENIDEASNDKGKRVALSFPWQYLQGISLGATTIGYPGYVLIAHCHTPQDVQRALQGQPVVVQ